MSNTLFVRDKDSKRYRKAQPQEVVQAAKTAIDTLFLRDSDALQDPDAVHQFLMAKIATRDQEVFVCLFLDNKNRVIAYEELFFGTIDSAAVYPRVVVKRALAHAAAAAVIFAHSHPSGDSSPSRADENITRRLKEALALVDIKVLDHLVIGGTGFTSLAKQGII